MTLPPDCLAELMAARSEAGFKPLPRVNFPEGELPLQVPPAPGTYAGMILPAATKIVEGVEIERSLEERALGAEWECYHCGARLKDAPRLRRQLMDSYEQAIPENPPRAVLFDWPEEASLGISFAESARHFLTAEYAHKRGNLVPKQDWYMQRRARNWNPKLVMELRARNQETYDVAMAKHDAWRLCMIVDNQKDLAQQWVMTLAVKANGSAKQLWRGSLNGLVACRNKQLEYGVDSKGKPLLKDQYVFLDGRYKPEQICRHIADHKYGHWATIGGERTWLAWNLMQGSRLEYHTHEEEKDKTKKFIMGDPNWREYRVDGNYVEILVFPFSATACGQRFEASRDGIGQEVSFLPRQDGEPPDDHELSHHSQIHSNQLVESKSFEPRAARMKYIPVPPSAPDHYFHMWRMFEGVKELWQVDGIYREKTETAAA